jgi:hypothetical protein
MPDSEPDSEVPASASPFWDDAKRLCNLLADLMVANGCKRPTIGQRWLVEMDRLMRIDGRTPEQVERAIRWAQADPFWAANILSPAALRRQYERLRLQAKREREYERGRQRSGRPIERPTDATGTTYSGPTVDAWQRWDVEMRKRLGVGPNDTLTNEQEEIYWRAFYAHAYERSRRSRGMEVDPAERDAYVAARMAERITKQEA